MNKPFSYERYQRQLKLKGFGETAQQRLLDAKVLIVGAGGLGCPALQYLTAAGVGTIGIVDDDVVELSNLHRQVLYAVNDIGKNKAIQAAGVLQQLNPDITILPFNERLTTANALQLISAFDCILDGSDNFATRYLVNDAVVLLNKPLVYGAVSQYEGQVAVFNCVTDSVTTPVNYRDLFPQPPAEGEVPNCEEAGVLGVLPGIIGTMMANETLKLITGIGSPLINRLLIYNALNNQQYEMEIIAREETRSLIPVDKNAFQQMDYREFCSAKYSNEIEIDGFNELLNKKNVQIIDVREPDEIPLITEFIHLTIPLARLEDNINILNANTIVLFCQSGKRSQLAAQQLSAIFGPAKKVFSLRGGILKWKQYHKMQQS